MLICFKTIFWLISIHTHNLHVILFLRYPKPDAPSNISGHLMIPTIIFHPLQIDYGFCRETNTAFHLWLRVHSLDIHFGPSHYVDYYGIRGLANGITAQSTQPTCSCQYAKPFLPLVHTPDKKDLQRTNCLHRTNGLQRLCQQTQLPKCRHSM